MSETSQKPADPLSFLKSLWGNIGGGILPGMMTPTLDIEELDKRISDLKVVENWMKMNLNMLQLTIQGLEMQRSTLVAFQSISQPVSSPHIPDVKPEPQPAPSYDSQYQGSGLSLWPWNIVPQASEEPEAAPSSSPPSETSDGEEKT